MSDELFWKTIFFFQGLTPTQSTPEMETFGPQLHHPETINAVPDDDLLLQPGTSYDVELEMTDELLEEIEAFDIPWTLEELDVNEVQSTLEGANIEEDIATWKLLINTNCPWCSFVGHNKKSLGDHIKESHKEMASREQPPLLNCDKCKTIFISKILMQKHIGDNHIENEDELEQENSTNVIEIVLLKKDRWHGPVW